MVLHESHDDTGLQVVTKACLCPVENSIIDRFEAHNCLYQPPTVHRHGWEEYSLIAFDDADVKSLYDDLETDREIGVMSKTGLDETQLPHSMLTPVDQLFGTLTDRQLAALQLALENGYYHQPRNFWSLISPNGRPSRATYEEHLRKAENKLLTNAGQFIRLLSESSSDTGLRKESSPLVAGDD